MASQNYLSDPKNPFFSLEDDIDDETFLKSAPPRSGLTTYNQYNNFDNGLEQKRQQLLQRKKEIEERTIQSTKRSISLLRDSEQIGAATAEELIRQREQLERTEKRLDDINSTLRFSQKHIQGIKSVFGSLKNYLSGKSMDAPIPSTILSESSSSESMTSPALSNSLEQVQTNIANTSPALKLHGLDNDIETNSLSNNVSKVLEQNLDEMSGSLARLKGLAIGLSEEIDLQNDLIDNITDKAEKTDIMLQKQNKDLTHLLKK
ncbi:synaptosomal-associated protein 29 [Bombus vosnesenskii]|uniref:Synaptosomal-associated protein 29 n=3 Tax=Pyrobombus TaxID=144703 RepID=A0A6J3L837_9HYME|nr:synaptosomal-associated protein 29 [Bombus impatiens]XP_033199144.1 synaptosomal-associated protein 29 [Bombus vancouverensis nearcticus]XP_033299783.1 synaptosomal-associated protein 29 [Bombus bifarius]XP_033360741.1 synaptosomal-associated protein 29 [Bombus vosnesenskii]XP_043583437.1 synaptosomal-associated protein 29 [Bombus pyrosoma]XP_050496268.1 synaptosomal-associated protein 29 [Bombus huntii]XP_060815752.1 synaptosomal-associated protein 29 [Bombus pascuorum]